MQLDRISTAKPPLDELLSEPIVAALMTSDGVDRAWLETLIAEKGEEQRETSGEAIV